MRIIDDVLDFSKIEAGRLELEETSFSLSELVHSVVATFRQRTTDKGLALHLEINPGSADALIGDPTRVRQIQIDEFPKAAAARSLTRPGNVAIVNLALPVAPKALQ